MTVVEIVDYLIGGEHVRLKAEHAMEFCRECERHGITGHFTLSFKKGVCDISLDNMSKREMKRLHFRERPNKKDKPRDE